MATESDSATLSGSGTSTSVSVGLLQKAANKNATEPAMHLSKLSYYDNDFVTAESGALETRR